VTYTLTPIATIRTPFKEKFGTPRQPGLTPSIRATVSFYPEFATPEAVRGLTEFSHIWLIFLFHDNWHSRWQPTVRPPRLGGNKRVGVYASRSPYRPNPIGLSAVRLLAVSEHNGQICLEIEGADLIDGTPIIDIKPYVRYGDCITDAVSGFAATPPASSYRVSFTAEARRQLDSYRHSHPNLEQQISEVLALDPRPAYRHATADERDYGVLLDSFNIRWRVIEEQFQVVAIEMRKSG